MPPSQPTIKIHPSPGRDAFVAKVKMKGVQVTLVVPKNCWEQAQQFTVQTAPLDVFAGLVSAAESGTLACDQLGPGCEGFLKIAEDATDLTGCRLVFR